MHSRVAAVKAPRTHNRRCVTESSGRRREGGESERQRPNMSRRVFASVVLFIVVVMMCCGTGGAANGKGQQSLDVQLPQEIDIFVPNNTEVVEKNGSASGVKFSFFSPSLVSAGGVMIALVEGRTKYKDPYKSGWLDSSDIVAGYINAAGTWPSIVAEVTKTEWRAHTALGSWNGKNNVGFWYWPTPIAKDNKVFLLVGGYEEKYYGYYNGWAMSDWDIQLVVGEATQATDIQHSKPISWGKPTSLLPQIPQKIKSGPKKFVAAGGSGIVMENGTLVFPLMVSNGTNHPFFMITYSTDNGKNWVFPEGTSRAQCTHPRIIEWENEKLLVVTLCESGHKVFESRDMGKTWTEALGTLAGVWANSVSGVSWDKKLHVGALITATIEGRKVMLYTNKARHPSEGSELGALYLWVTDNSRMCHFGPLFVDSAEKKTFANTLLYSDGELYLSQQRGSTTSTAVSLARLTEELNKIKSVLSTWAKLDAFFLKLSIPTAGLVGFLSNAANGETWIDKYRCVDATVTNAAKVDNGFKFTGPSSGATWPVNSREDNNHYGFVNLDFTLVAMVTIHQVPNVSTPLLGASLGDSKGTKFIGLSYGANGAWETVFNGRKKSPDSNWELEREYLVALMLQGGNKGFVYVDGALLGSSETMPPIKTLGHEITHFYFGGGEGDNGSNVTVTNVLLYNRLLDVGEIKTPFKSIAAKLKEYGDSSMHEGASRVLVVLLGLCAFAFLC
ncbi:trans-sialidase, putative [Trypanosoma cruzi marinkellei]|uniref:Trans-sialidase, putative n=1 Tax=Trypanosoma cruzi marinkellei TaxID=85056 RepID=K2N4A6_TRYCR|nr:trans-sialidase, putative [Trypanosoma cruzi marinkellei]